MLTTANIPWIFRLGTDTPVADAVRLLSDAANHVGLNRARIRDYLAGNQP
jgi:hypothetical protein